ncbi:MAG: hypothetical protein WDN46_25060 [Methylocella sp.]
MDSSMHTPFMRALTRALNLNEGQRLTKAKLEAVQGCATPIEAFAEAVDAIIEHSAGPRIPQDASDRKVGEHTDYEEIIELLGRIRPVVAAELDESYEPALESGFANLKALVLCWTHFIGGPAAPAYHEYSAYDLAANERICRMAEATYPHSLALVKVLRAQLEVIINARLAVRLNSKLKLAAAQAELDRRQWNDRYPDMKLLWAQRQTPPKLSPFMQSLMDALGLNDCKAAIK